MLENFPNLKNSRNSWCHRRSYKQT